MCSNGFRLPKELAYDRDGRGKGEGLSLAMHAVLGLWRLYGTGTEELFYAALSDTLAEMDQVARVAQKAVLEKSSSQKYCM